LTYPECPFAMRDKIACAQYIAALSDGFIKRILQLEGVFLLNFAVKRAKAIKVIQRESSDRKKRNYYFEKRKDEEKEKISCKSDRMENREERDYKGKGNVSQKGKVKKRFPPKDCWQCRKEGHFRSECSENKGNSD